MTSQIRNTKTRIGITHAVTIMTARDSRRLSIKDVTLSIVSDVIDVISLKIPPSSSPSIERSLYSSMVSFTFSACVW